MEEGATRDVEKRRRANIAPCRNFKLAFAPNTTVRALSLCSKVIETPFLAQYEPLAFATELHTLAVHNPDKVDHNTNSARVLFKWIFHSWAAASTKPRLGSGSAREPEYGLDT
jgi:hypothetical protein